MSVGTSVPTLSNGDLTVGSKLATIFELETAEVLRFQIIYSGRYRETDGNLEHLQLVVIPNHYAIRHVTLVKAVPNQPITRSWLIANRLPNEHLEVTIYEGFADWQDATPQQMSELQDLLGNPLIGAFTWRLEELQRQTNNLQTLYQMLRV